MNNFISLKKTNKNLWILTEERPKLAVLQRIIELFARDNNIAFFTSSLRLIPLLDKMQNFTFTYLLLGIESAHINNILIRTVSGNTSFVDFLVFFQENLPITSDLPIYAIEETKTSDSESRNTGVYQRASKFVLIDMFYPNIRKVMLYNHSIEMPTKVTSTNIFGTRLLLTIGVEFIGKNLTNEFIPFSTFAEIIQVKNDMRSAPTGNVPITIMQTANAIYISGRLYKNGSLAHDPNIGALSLISASLRKLGYKGEIIITQHGLEQKHLSKTNKFCRIASLLNINFEGLIRVEVSPLHSYWHYEEKSEKLATIFLHIIIESFTQGYSVFENHAGCEKGYFIKANGTPIALEKYENRSLYKAGDKNAIIAIPDVIFIDPKSMEILNVEGKQYQYRHNGIEELNVFHAIESIYIKPEYPNYKIIRTVVLYGSFEEKIIEMQVSFLLNANGKVILGVQAPKLFKQAVANMLEYW